MIRKKEEEKRKAHAKEERRKRKKEEGGKEIRKKTKDSREKKRGKKRKKEAGRRSTLRVFPAETRLTVYRRFNIRNLCRACCEPGESQHIYDIGRLNLKIDLKKYNFFSLKNIH